MKKPDWLILSAILLVASYLRFNRLNYVEFKEDEAGALLLALSIPASGFSGAPEAGLASSIGIYNPPLFIYIIALPVLISRDPLFVTGFVAFLNLVAVGICYIGMRKFFGRDSAVVSSLLLATLPSAVIYSRKIWAQDLMIPFGVSIAVTLVAFLKTRSFSSQAGVVGLSGTVWQIHLSGLFILPVILGALIWKRSELRVKALLLGAFLALLPLIPHINFALKTKLESVSSVLEVIGKGKAHSPFLSNLAEALSAPVVLLNSSFLVKDYGYDFRGVSLPAFWFLQCLSVILTVSLVLLVFRRRVEELFLCSFLLIPPFILPVAGVRVLRSYYVLLLPSALMIIGIASQLIRRKKLLYLYALVFVANCVLWMNFTRDVVEWGGLKKEYGTAYIHKLRASRYLAERVDSIECFRTLCPPDDQMRLDLAYLVLYQGLKTSRVSAPRGMYAVLDRLRGEECPPVTYPPTAEFGPIQIFFLGATDVSR